ncbi:MAG: nucleotidyltransferase domain-containing protein [Acidobacteriia bacterium]|nr:nucleotidyltransferase domain-containing protein [Terriglobia bacterium]
MAPVTETLLNEMARAIVEAVEPERVILFGSHARGAAGPGSDVDLLVVEKRPFGPGRSRRREIARIRGALSRFRIPKDILVFASDEVERFGDSRNHVVGTTLREGRVFYERS